MFADRALLQTVCFAELPHCLAIFPRAQTEHEFLPYSLRQRLPAMEHLVAAQPDLPIFRRTNSRPLDGYFLSHHDAVPAFCAPPRGIQSNLIVGDAVSTLLHRRQVFEHNHGNFVQSPLPGSDETRIARNDLPVRVDKDGIGESELVNARSNLCNLRVGVRSSIALVGGDFVHSPELSLRSY